MTAPAPISVERLRELIAEYWDLAYAEGAESRSHDTPAGDAMRVSAEIDKCIAALLHQLDELKRELSQSRDFNAELNLLLDTAKHERDVAERARDEATGLLRECDTVAKLRGEYGVADCIDNDGQPYQSAHLDAFLAASGGEQV